jgi:hypothetical protein
VLVGWNLIELGGLGRLANAEMVYYSSLRRLKFEIGRAHRVSAHGGSSERFCFDSLGQVDTSLREDEPLNKRTLFVESLSLR